MRVIHQAVGQITESDVLLAVASDAIVVGFHTKPDPQARELAEHEKVEIRLYDIIYKAVEDVKSALEGLLKPELKEVVTGSAEVRQVFRLSKAGTVAGCMVVSGTIPRTGKVRLLRDGETVWNGRIASLKRFKDDVKEVASGFECGISLEGRDDVKVGDIIESFNIEELARTLVATGGPAMFVGVVRIELHLPGAASLKDKRAVLRGLKDRIRQRTQAAVAEVDHQDLWQRAALGVAVVSGERRQVGELLQAVRQLADGTPGAEVIDWQETLL